MSNRFFRLAAAALLPLGLCAPALAVQPKGGRTSITKTNTPPRTNTPPGNKEASRPATRRAERVRANDAGSGRRPEPAPAGLSASVTPPDSKIVLGGAEYSAVQGALSLSRIKPGTHRVVVSREGYRSKEFELAFAPGRVTPLSVSLEPLFGTLDVAPAVAGAEISILEAGGNEIVGSYFGRAANVKLPSGRYRIIVSKEGYRTATTEIAVQPSHIVLLAPPLELLPKAPAPPPRRSAPPQFRPDPAMSAQTSVEGKFIVVTLTGRSGDTSNAFGEIGVTMSRGGHMWAAHVSGLLSGRPCRVDFVRLENVAEYSFVEPPGAQNKWARAVVRVRPKEQTRPVRFLINWYAL